MKLLPSIVLTMFSWSDFKSATEPSHSILYCITHSNKNTTKHRFILVICPPFFPAIYIFNCYFFSFSSCLFLFPFYVIPRCVCLASCFFFPLASLPCFYPFSCLYSACSFLPFPSKTNITSCKAA